MKSLETKQNEIGTLQLLALHLLLHIHMRVLFDSIRNGQRAKVRTVWFRRFIFMFTKFNIHPYNRVETNFTQKLKKKREMIRTNAPHKRLQFTHTSICTLCSKNKNKSKDKHNRIECCTRTAYSTIIVMSI